MNWSNHARQFKKLSKQHLAMTREIGEIDTAFRAANRRGERDRQDSQKTMPSRVTVPSVRELRETRPDRLHPGFPTAEGIYTNPSF